MDEPTSQLIGAHGYCTQVCVPLVLSLIHLFIRLKELVNLILTGKAVSNVFDDTMTLGSGSDKVNSLFLTLALYMYGYQIYRRF